MRSIYFPFIIISLLLMIGVTGYMFFEGFNFWEAVYMTVITVTTVGFNEVRPLSFEGRIFTIFLILGSFGTFAYTITEVTKYVVDGEFRRLLLHIRVDRSVNKLKNHTILCGYGRNGRQAYQTLIENGESCVVVEKDKEIITELMENDKVLFIEGDATHDDVLLRAGIKDARALISALPKDADNLFVVLTARVNNSKLKIISRASEENSDTKLRHAGVNNVIMPDAVGGAHMASIVVSSDIMEFIDQIKIPGDETVNLEEISFSDLNNEFKNKSIGELEAKKMTGCNIIGFKNKDNDYVINPPLETIVEPGTKLFVLGRPDQIDKLNNILGIHF